MSDSLLSLDMEAPAMHRRRAESLYRFDVSGCAVALVLGEIIARVVVIEIDHHPVAHDLGNDRGGGNVQRAGVATGEGEFSQLRD